MDIAVERAARFLAEHCGGAVSLGDVSDHVGYSPYHLARSFESRLGVSPGRFLIAHRFQLAKRLLLDTDARVADVCMAAGFASLGTFTTRFSALVGLSPVAFRRLPHLLAEAPPRPVLVPGLSARGGRVAGRVRLTPAADAVLGRRFSVYVGLFASREAKGLPLSGAMLEEPGFFALEGVPQGTYFLLASAVADGWDFRSQLVPPRSVTGVGAGPLYPDAGSSPRIHDVVLDVADDWRAPVVVA
ncbi:MAG: helix-turn-helix transcriptional regulator, partial [Acidimicrobiales bacterium]